MNSAPMLLGSTLPITGCGREAASNAARAFFQSRMVRGGQVPPLPELTDIRALAISLRAPNPEQAGG